MIHRTHRFHGHNSLRFVYRNGKTIRCSYLALKFAHNPRRQTYRVAIVVSRKVHKSAVVRNRIRRRMYEVVREQAPHIQNSYDMVFTVFSDQLASMQYEELKETIAVQLSKARIIPHLSSESAKNHAIVKL